jgi:hypothetical protein
MLYPPPDVLFAAMGPFLIDSGNEPWIFHLARVRVMVRVGVRVRAIGIARALCP